ncbi:hypothetical protein QSJ18_16175 [Gordonia sp. ABSL1-1]|uniref:hypothetical protein n=1 Tax=Gordonia sp. ABSL1-1 TaxID=3053923 RepID=UPI0025746501|nr:hypothetical protein [Gordonia sp. ABSL1-1]MDL9938289.1 hypothetical protein [Gordonia sp. ABSL1-1]
MGFSPEAISSQRAHAQRVHADALAGLRRQMAVLSGDPDRRSPERPDRSADALVMPECLSEVLPQNGIPRGTVACLGGANSMLVAMIASVTGAGGRVGIVGLPGLNLLSAVEMGADLSRIAVIPAPGLDPVEVAAVLLDGMDLVVLGARGTAVAPSRARVVQGRARKQSSVLLVVGGDWPGAQLRLDAEVITYRHSPDRSVVDLTAARNGYGRIGGMRLRVTVSRRSGRPGTVEVELVTRGQWAARQVELVHLGDARPELAVAN